MGRSRTIQGVPSRPLGVLLLALLQIWHGLWYLVITLVLFASSSLSSDEGEADKSGVLFLLALAYLLLGICALWLARGYVKGVERARRRGISVAVFAIALVLVSFLIFRGQILVPESPFWTIVGNVIIIWYLRRENVKKFFAARSAIHRR